MTNQEIEYRLLPENHVFGDRRDDGVVKENQTFGTKVETLRKVVEAREYDVEMAMRRARYLKDNMERLKQALEAEEEVISNSRKAEEEEFYSLEEKYKLLCHRRKTRRGGGKNKDLEIGDIDKDAQGVSETVHHGRGNRIGDRANRFKKGTLICCLIFLTLLALRLKSLVLTLLG